MSSVDERIVRMQFDNAAFEAGIAKTRDSLGRFTKDLQLKGATKGLQDVENAASRFSLRGLEQGVQGIADKFKAMSVVGVTALATITSKAVSAGLQMAKSFTVQPIIDGFHEYETNIGSIQTILANTGLEGEKGLAKVNGALNELNHYADKTIYNFSEMARNIGTFTAAGVSLDKSTAAIKGIANLAAVSGSNSQQASTAMYQLSQALAAGKVSLEDWNSVVQAGMGGKVFQDALKETARVHGVAIDKMVKDEGGFRNTLQKGWLTSKILTETLAKFTGDLNEKQLKQMGYTAKQAKEIIKMGKTAQDAATKVKTFSQLIDTLKEAIGSGWTQTWSTIFGNFNEARDLFTSVSDTLGGFINASSNARNKVLSDWKQLGGRTALIDGIGNAFHALISIMKPIGEAFREIFPPTTGKQLYDMTVAFRNFTEKLKVGGETADKLKRTFAGVFAIFGIAWDVIKGVASVLAHLFGVVTQGSGGFLGLTAKIGDFLVNLKKAIEQGDGLKKVFQTIGTVLAVPIKLLQKFAGYLSDLFDHFDADKAVTGITSVTTKLGPFGKLLEIVRGLWGKLMDQVAKVGDLLGPAADKLAEFFHNIGPAIADAFKGMDFGSILDVFNTGLFAGLFLLFKRLVDKFKGGGGGFGDIVDSISEGFETLTGSLKTMQNLLKATTLLQIAAAVGILAVSMNILAKIDADGLKRATGAMTIMFSQLVGSMAIFTKFIGTAGFAKMPFVMGSLILLAGAILVLSDAVKNLSTLDWNGLAKGLTGVVALLGGLLGVMKLMPNPAGMIGTATGLVILAGAIKILASAVSDLSGLSWQDLAKGLVGVGALLGSLILFTMFAKADAGGIAQGAGLILLASAIKILASAVDDMSKMSWGEIAKGLVTLAGALGIITGALMLIPPTAGASALGVLGVAISLGMIAKALDDMSGFSWGEIGKSLTLMTGALAIISGALFVIPPTAPLAAVAVLGVALSLQMIAGVLNTLAQFSWEEIGKSMTLLAGTLGLIAGAMFIMQTALPGAAALLVVTAALLGLQPVLAAFGEMSLAEIGKSLLMLAGVFVVIGAAGLLLAPITPIILALGIAIGILGVGLLAAGGGVFLFATGLTALAAAGTAGAAAIIGIVTGLIGLIPELMKQIGLGIVAFAKVIATAGPAIFKAMTTVIGAMIDAIAKLTPKIVTTLLSLLSQLLSALAKYVPRMVTSGINLVIGILNGIAQKLPTLITAATNVVVAFINGISKNLGRVIDAGVKLIISFVNGVANAIRSNTPAMNAAGRNLATAIVQGMASGLLNGISMITSAAKSVASSALSAAKGVLGIHSPSKEFEKIGNYVNDGFRKGLDGNKDQIDAAFKSLADQLKALSKNAKVSAKERARALDTYKALVNHLDDEHSALQKLSKSYDTYTQKIKDAQQALEDAKKTRDDYNKSIKDQYSDVATPAADDTVQSFTDNLKKQLEDTKQFANTLQRLRDLGLNDQTYKDLLAAGPGDLAFANNLLAGGKGAVDEINSLSKQLGSVSASLGKTASTELYQAGVDAANGLVKGLQLKQADIEKQMDKIADAMVKAIKKHLGIKSPSRVLMGVGEYSAEGIAVGMDNMSHVVEKAATDAGQTAIDALSKTMTGFSDLISGKVEVQPVITPVLDLSGVKKDASQIGSILTTQPISVDSSYAKAVTIAASKAAQPTTDTTAAVGISKSFVFNQYNTSPKALSSADIYRQTNNQLSKVKGALSTSASD